MQDIQQKTHYEIAQRNITSKNEQIETLILSCIHLKRELTKTISQNNQLIKENEQLQTKNQKLIKKNQRTSKVLYKKSKKERRENKRAYCLHHY